MNGQTRRQFRVLYRDFLFRIVDRELLSMYAKGDASQLLLQFVALLLFLSLCVSIPALTFGPGAPLQMRLAFAVSIEHFLIATTMLMVGIFAVLSWDSMFPSHGDVLVLAPLPVRAHTILLAKAAAVTTALGLALITFHVVAGLVWPLALSNGSVRMLIRLLAAYWVTMIAAGGFVFGLAMSVQGLAAALLSRRSFLRISSWLQLAAFSLIVGLYLLQPAWSPSRRFLGVFQQLAGAPDATAVAARAWIGLAVVIAGTVVAYALSYFHTLRRIAEQPDIAPSVTRARWLPTFGDSLQTALVQFSVRTLIRSAPHRVILAFYWGLGFAAAIVFLKTPRGQQLAAGVGGATWQATSVPLLISSLVMMGFAVLGARIAFAMPRDLRANWIFRIVPARAGMRYATARRRAIVAVSVAPAWILSAMLFLSTWPWRPAASHLLALALLGLIAVEISLVGAQKIPFTCSYLPGKSRKQMSGFVAVALLVPITIKAAEIERDALQNPILFTVILSMLGIVWAIVRIANAWMGDAKVVAPEFEDEPAGQPVILELWDARVSRR